MSKLEKKYYPLVFVVPALIIFTLFYVCSIAGGFVFSFTNWSIYNFESPEFIGIENFKGLIRVAELSASARPYLFVCRDYHCH